MGHGAIVSPGDVMGSARRIGIETSGTAWPLACALTLLAWLVARLVIATLHGPLSPDPDAAYTLVIARNLIEQGRLTFDGETLTNGFSPLWLALLAAKQRLAGSSMTIVFSAEAVMLSTALFVLLRCLGVANRLFQVAFTAAFAWLAAGFYMTGSDAALTVLCVSLFVAALCWDTESLAGGLVLAVTAILCAATRLEAVVFLLPALLLAPTRLANRVLAVSLFTAALIGYGVANQHFFGAVLPMAGQVHGLGGLQINRVLLAQIGAEWRLDGAGARHLVLGLGLLTAPLLAPLARPGTAAQALSAGASVGGWVLAACLLLGSSWRLSPGLGSAGLWPLIALFWTATPPLAAAVKRLHERLGSPRLAQPVATGLSGLILASLLGESALAATDAAPQATRSDPVQQIGRMLADHRSTLAGARIAMGDGAGMLAVLYPGSVMALEGAAGDQAYFTALESSQDITPLLCARGVRFIAAYQTPLGDYGRRRLPALSGARTGFAGPSLEIDPRDVVARLAVTDGRTLYLWRLGACWRNGYPAAAASAS